MPDHLYVRVPRLAEQEPGFMDDEAMRPDAASLSTEGAFYERLSRRWMATPTESGVGSGSSDWSASVDLVEMSLLASGGTGVETTAETWTMVRTAELELGRGFYVDLWPYEPADSADFTQPLTIAWGTSPRWTVCLTPSEAGPGLAEITEFDGTTEKQVVSCVLLRGPFYNQLHRLWFQPLDDDEWLVSNRDVADLGCLVRTQHPYTYDPDDGSSTDDGPPESHAPWGPGPLRIDGKGRAWVVYREVVYPSEWTIAAKGPRTLDYLCTQDVTAEINPWLPDGKRTFDADTGLGSAYDADLKVYEGELKEGEADPDEWAADAVGQTAYGWRLTVTGPEDAGTSLSKRTVCVDRMLLRWVRTLGTDGATPVDLFDHATVTVTGLRESRSYRDADGQLFVTLYGPVEELRYLTLPGQRWQWVMDQATDGQPEDLYIRFDGMRDVADLPRWTNVADEWLAECTVTIRTRWRQAEAVLYRGQLRLDGMLRSTAYIELAQLIPLDSTEVVIPTALPDDDLLPAGRRGEGPLWKPEIGQRLSDLLLSLAETMGPKDRLLFRDQEGVACLVIDQPSEASVATFYRTQAEADSAVVPAQCIRDADKTRALTLADDDSEFYNEIIVMGTAPAPAVPDTAAGVEETLQRGAPILAMFSDPESWKLAEIGGAPNLRYVGVRRTLIAVMPQLNTDAAVQRMCRQLVERYYRFSSAGRFIAGFVETLYPGDVVTIDAGTEPTAASKVLVIRGMDTELVNLTVARSHRYTTVYEVGEAVD